MFLTIKQYITERKIFSKLAEKIKKSKKFEYFVDKEENDICKLDNIDICFGYHDTLKVCEKTGKQILSLYCHYYDFNKISQMRFKCFHSLKNIAKKRSYIENQGKETKTVISEKQQIILTEALQKIRGA
jgi:hypothetical protein